MLTNERHRRDGGGLPQQPRPRPSQFMLEPDVSLLQGVGLHESFRSLMDHASLSSTWQQLERFLRMEVAHGKMIYPPRQDLFRAFAGPCSEVKVVIVGQDPYHGPGQAHGLAFSVPYPQKPPSSLQNIFRELQSDLGWRGVPSYGDLRSWAQQGVLLINTVLTVEAGSPGSHAGRGWEKISAHVLEHVSAMQKHCVFMLWGRYAQSFGALIDTTRHLVIQSSHPSPFAAHRGFFGSRAFSRCNHFLVQKGLPPIDWRLPLPEVQRERLRDNRV